MAREKATITVDRAKLAQARELTGARSASDAIDLALTELINHEQLRRDITLYAARPPAEEEVALASLRIDWSDLADDTDWDSAYEGEEGDGAAGAAEG